MGRKSTLNKLPEDVTKELDKLLADPRYTQQEIADLVNTYLIRQHNHQPVITKDIVQGYAAVFREVQKKREASTVVVKEWIARMGDLPDGDFGRAIVEVLRTLAFDMTMDVYKSNKADLPASIRMLKDLAMTVEKVERSATENEKREQEIRYQEREQALKDASAALKQAGISSEIEAAYNRILIGKS